MKKITSISLFLLSATINSLFGQNISSSATSSMGLGEKPIYKDDGRPPFSDPIAPTKEQLDAKQAFFVKRAKETELYKLKFREWGIKFWEKNPNDPQRFVLLLEMVTNSPRYFSDVDEGAIDEVKKKFSANINHEERKKWDLKYAKLRREFMNAEEVSQKLKYDLISTELRIMVDEQQWVNIRNGNAFDIDSYCQNLISYARYYYSQKRKSPVDVINENYVTQFVRKASSLGISFDDQSVVMNKLMRSGIKGLAEVASKYYSLIELSKNPFRLNAKEINGSIIDLEKYRGKMVLVDFWSTGCVSCIAKMPSLKATYNKFKDFGFEVISVSVNDVNSKVQKEAVIKIHNSIGADWPLVMIGGTPSLQASFSAYGFRGTPQLIMLDRGGKLLRYNGDLLDADALENLVKEYLSK